MTTNQQQGQRREPRTNPFAPLIVDVAVPLGVYYLAKEAFGTSTFAALVCSSVVPAVRTGWGLVKERVLKGLPLLILVVNLAGLALSFVSGDPRLMLAKDGAVSSVVGIGILVSVWLGRPMMSEGIRPFLVQGDGRREAAWGRLARGEGGAAVGFRAKERLFSVIFGTVLLVECVVKVVGVYTLPVSVMVWLGSVLLAVAIGIGVVLGRRLAGKPMFRILEDEVRREAEENSSLAGSTHGYAGGLRSRP